MKRFLLALAWFKERFLHRFIASQIFPGFLLVFSFQSFGSTSLTSSVLLNLVLSSQIPPEY